MTHLTCKSRRLFLPKIDGLISCNVFHGIHVGGEIQGSGCSCKPQSLGHEVSSKPSHLGSNLGTPNQSVPKTF